MIKFENILTLLQVISFISLLVLYCLISIDCINAWDDYVEKELETNPNPTTENEER